MLGRRINNKGFRFANLEFVNLVDEMGMIEIRRIGIKDLDTDVIVNAANENLKASGGVSESIFKAAGSAQLAEACDQIGHCTTGSAVITPGFNTNARYIIHAVGPVWCGGSNNESKLLYRAYRSSLQLAVEKSCTSIGFPLISAGAYGFPVDKAWQVAIQACNDFLEENGQIDIIFAVLSNTNYIKGLKALKEISPKYAVAVRSDWPTKDMPALHESFTLSREFTKDQMRVFRKGNIPNTLESNWFWYMEGKTLFAHRSWTGFCIYRIDFSSDNCHRVTINRDYEQYKGKDVDKDREQLNKLLDQWISASYDNNEWLTGTIDNLNSLSNINITSFKESLADAEAHPKHSYLVDLIQTHLKDFEVSLYERIMSQDEEICTNCWYPLQSLENMIIIKDNNERYFGVNAFYCLRCHHIYLDNSELEVVEDQLDEEYFETLAVYTLKNFEHNIDADIVEEETRGEATLRNLLDRINIVNEKKHCKFVKAKKLPLKCPVCDSKFIYSDEVAVLYRNDDVNDYPLRGCFCSGCGEVIYIEEASLIECLAAGVTIDNLLEVIIDNESEKNSEIVEMLEGKFIDGETLYIHQGNIICDKKKHNVISVTAEMPAANTGEIVQININYCCDCDKCFINETVYEEYRSKGLLPAVKFVRAKADGTYPSEYETDLAPESPLHLLGYNVSQKDDYSESYRHHLLSNIMDCGVLSKHRIEYYLTMFIKKSMSQKNMALAVSKWKTDLEFVENYDINRQVKVKIQSVQPYNK